MAWSSRFQALMVKPLIRQLAAIINRDMAAAVASVGRNEIFNQFDLALVPIRLWPAILIIPASDEFDENADLERKQDVAVIIVIAVTHTDRNQLMEVAEDYALAVDRILNSVAGTDFYTSLPLPLISGFVQPTTVQMTSAITNVTQLWVIRHDYGMARRRANSSFAMTVTMDVRCQMEEA